MRLQSGEEIGFEKLVVATGAQVRTLDIPGSELSRTFTIYERSRTPNEFARRRRVRNGRL